MERLKKEIRDYIDIAKLTKKDRAKEESLSSSVSENIQSNVQEQINKAFNSEDDDNENPEIFEEESEISTYIEYQNVQNSAPETVSDQVRTYQIPVNPFQTCTIRVKWAIGDNSSWISVDVSEDQSISDIKLNINHPFFKPFSEKEEFKEVLEKFAIAFALSEISCKTQSSKEGYIPAAMFRNFINKYLKELSSDI